MFLPLSAVVLLAVCARAQNGPTLESGVEAGWALAQSAAQASRGKVAFLWGDMDPRWVEMEKKRFEPLARRLEKSG
jgi:hypothetical protein